MKAPESRVLWPRVKTGWKNYDDKGRFIWVMGSHLVSAIVWMHLLLMDTGWWACSSVVVVFHAWAMGAEVRRFNDRIWKLYPEFDAGRTDRALCGGAGLFYAAFALLVAWKILH